METATLTSPRSLIVPPIQKSLSLPSYARASGEGIDHTIIFAALEQREKIRRKSKIFRDKEKSGSSRQNYFCLPLPSNGKCRETSFSSDTSCSSLEFQKPKCRASPTKLTNGVANENSSQNNHINNQNTPSPSPTKFSNITSEVAKREPMAGSRNSARIDNSRSTIGSSDSIERTEKSSKSSNDSLTRKERLIAIKARVEAERGKNICDSSSDEEFNPRMSRHNSDGHIHKTVREVKSKSCKQDKRYRRRTQDEMAIRRALRKQHTSLYLPHTSADFDVAKSSICRSGSSLSLQRDSETYTKEFLGSNHKTCLESISYTNSFSNHSYFSDICSGNLRTRVRSRIEEIESKQLENKLMKTTLRTDNANLEDNVNTPEKSDSNSYKSKFKNSPYASANHNCSKGNVRSPEKDFILSRASPPIPRAPTPPPRSPKSIEFVNKAFIHHQNATNYQQGARSLERKKNIFNANIANYNNKYNFTENTNGSSENSISDRRNKSITNMRRRTLCNFPHIDEIMSAQRPQTPTNYQRNKFSPQNFPPRSPDLSHKTCDASRKIKGYASGSDIATSKTNLQSDLTGKKWEKLELDSEKKFNSLENRSKINTSMFLKDKFSHKPSCFGMCDNQCETQKIGLFKADEKYCKMFQISNLDSLISKDTNYEKENKISKSMPTSKTPPIPMDRLCKSEMNLTKRSSIKTPSPKLKTKIYNEKNIVEANEELFSFNNRNESENLDTAMKELESIYHSLRISTENLATISNERQQNCRRNEEEKSLLKESPKVSFLQNKYDPSRTFAKEMENTKTNEITNHSTIVPNVFPINNENIRNTLCIEELFTDLTQQLDLEQKLLQESKGRKNSNASVSQQTNSSLNVNLSKISTNFETNTNQWVSNIIPQIQNQPPITRSDVREALMFKRKKDAIESIKTKLNHVMETDAQFNDVSNKYEKNRSAIATDITYHCKHNVKNDAVPQKNVICTSLCQKSEDSDEIWQVRVSMSKNRTNSNASALSTDCSQSNYSRLRSALRLPRTGNSREPSPCPGSPRCHEISSNDSNNSNDLDKILNTLMNEVPHLNNQCSSQKTMQPKLEESDQSVTKGEMLVLQHLDLIRNIDPS